MAMLHPQTLSAMPMLLWGCLLLSVLFPGCMSLGTLGRKPCHEPSLWSCPGPVTLGEAEVRWEGATGPLALSVRAGAGPGIQGCAMLGWSRHLLWPWQAVQRAAEEPASVPLGEPVRRASCPRVSIGAQALKELGERGRGWLTGSLPSEASEPLAEGRLLFEGLWPAGPKQLNRGQADNRVQGGTCRQLCGRSGSRVAYGSALRLALGGGAASGALGGPRPRQVSGWASHTALPPAASWRGWQSSCGQSWGHPPSSPGSWACWPPVVSGRESVVVLTSHLGRLSGNWEFPREKRTGQRGGSEDRRVLGEPSPPGRPLRRPHGQPQSSRSCWACSQPSVAQHTQCLGQDARAGAGSAEACVQSRLPPGGRGAPVSIRCPGPGAEKDGEKWAATSHAKVGDHTEA